MRQNQRQRTRRVAGGVRSPPGKPIYPTPRQQQRPVEEPIPAASSGKKVRVHPEIWHTEVPVSIHVNCATFERQYARNVFYSKDAAA